MAHILYEYGSSRLYAKDNGSLNARYFISAKTSRLRRLQISAAFASDLDQLEAEEFEKKVNEVLDRARENGTPEYYEVKP